MSYLRSLNRAVGPIPNAVVAAIILVLAGCTAAGTSTGAHHGTPQAATVTPQAYQISRRQFSAPRVTSKSTKIQRPPASSSELTSRHLVVPVAALLVVVLSRLF